MARQSKILPRKEKRATVMERGGKTEQMWSPSIGDMIPTESFP
jgi:hypothetical protein